MSYSYRNRILDPVRLRSAKSLFTFVAVYNVFHNVAEKYDIMNDAMSVGIHRLWKDYFVRRMSPTPGTRLLDVAGGTGNGLSVVCSDISISKYFLVLVLVSVFKSK